jgi:hypothetical protein
MLAEASLTTTHLLFSFHIWFSQNKNLGVGTKDCLLKMAMEGVIRYIRQWGVLIDADGWVNIRHVPVGASDSTKGVSSHQRWGFSGQELHQINWQMPGLFF